MDREDDSLLYHPRQLPRLTVRIFSKLPQDASQKVRQGSGLPSSMLTISWLAGRNLGSKPQLYDSLLNSWFLLKAVATHSLEAFLQEAAVSGQRLFKDGLWPPV